ncbi:MFS transporter [Arthrobacter sp. A5]|uniref:MFS transporter n=1 Tax=Arthrobacter sp. A5 TaxID=576926 RepID=UPI003DAA2370
MNTQAGSASLAVTGPNATGPSASGPNQTGPNQSGPKATVLRAKRGQLSARPDDEPFGETLEETLAPELPEHLPSPAAHGWLPATLGIAAVVLIGLNLRAGIASAAALFHDLQQVMGYGSLIAAVLPSIPTLCFAVAGAGTSWLVRRLGVEKAIAVALLMLTSGLAVRGVPSVGILLVGTLVSMSGLAVCNVAMPSFIRDHYAHKTALLTGVYTITMSAGATVAAAVSVPLAQQLHSPSLGLAAWAILSVVTLLAFLPMAVAAHRSPETGPGKVISPWSLLRTRAGLLITAFFSVQGLIAYSLISWLPYILTSRGLDAAASGMLLAVMQVVSVPGNVLLLTMAGRPRLLRHAFVLSTGSLLVGAFALLLLPVGLAALPAVLLGFGLGVFPLVLVVISRSGSSTAETTAMSTLAQSVGYLVATIGPLGMGLLHGATGDWTLPLILLAAVGALQVVLGYLLAGPATKPEAKRTPATNRTSA